MTEASLHLRARRACLKMIERGFSPYEVAARAAACADLARTPPAATALYAMVDWISNR